MARYIDAKCRLCRREGTKLFLKGSRCEGPMCALTRRQTPPGQHGAKYARRRSGYGNQLREKQKAKRYYGILEGQFKNYYQEALRSKGKTGEALLTMLERRLDNVAYRIGFGLSKSHARQLIRQGKIFVNGRKVLSPAFSCKTKDELVFKGLPQEIREVSVPEWIGKDKKDSRKAVVSRLPVRADIAQDIDEQMIVEFYSR